MSWAVLRMRCETSLCLAIKEKVIGDFWVWLVFAEGGFCLLCFFNGRMGKLLLDG